MMSSEERSLSPGSGGGGGEEEVEESSSTTTTSVLRVKVKTMQPATYDVELASNSTVGNLKEQVQSASSVDVDRQRILFCGRVLSDNDKSLGECGVKDGHTLHMVERPPDVPPQPQNNQPPGAHASATAAGGVGGGMGGGAPGPLPPAYQRIAIGTINTTGVGGGGGEPPANVDRLISGLMNAIGSSIQQGNIPGVHGMNAAAGNPNAAAGGQAGPGNAGGVPSMQVQQVEINIDAVPASQDGGAPRSNQPLPNATAESHPFLALDSFINQMQTIMRGYQSQNPIVDRGNPSAESSNNSEARHLAVECDICGMCPIRGSRFKSLSHNNYDLCGTCVQTEGAREQEPFVQVDIPICNQFTAENVLASRRTSQPQQQERFRSAITTVLGNQSSEEGSDANDASDASDATEESGEPQNWDRLTVSALCELLKRINSVVCTEANDFINHQLSTISSQLDTIDFIGGRHNMHGNIILTSSVLNALGGMFIEMGRLFGGLNLPLPGNEGTENSGLIHAATTAMGSTIGYVHSNGSQVFVPPPIDRSALLFGSALPAGLLHSFSFAPGQRGGGDLSRNPSQPEPGAAPNPNTASVLPLQENLRADRFRPSVPYTPFYGTAGAPSAGAGQPPQPNPSAGATAAGAAGAGAAAAATTTVPTSGAPATTNTTRVTTSNVGQVFGNRQQAQERMTDSSPAGVSQEAERSAQAEASSTVNSFPVLMGSEEANEEIQASGEDEELQCNDASKEEQSDPKPVADTVKKESDEPPRGSGGLGRGLGSGFLLPKRKAPEKAKENPAPEAAKDEKDSEEAPRGLGSGFLRPRRTVIRKVAKPGEDSAGGQPGSSSSSGLSLPSRSKAATAVAEVKRDAGEGSSSESVPNLGGMLGQLMPMMNQLLGEGGDAGDDAERDDICELDGDAFERSLQQDLSEEEQERWLSIIRKDELEQEEMRLREPFSDAFLSLDRYDFE